MTKRDQVTLALTRIRARGIQQETERKKYINQTVHE